MHVPHILKPLTELLHLEPFGQTPDLGGEGDIRLAELGKLLGLLAEALEIAAPG
jgi:hypothetical protein